MVECNKIQPWEERETRLYIFPSTCGMYKCEKENKGRTIQKLISTLPARCGHVGV
jgi:hypothetical protein